MKPKLNTVEDPEAKIKININDTETKSGGSDANIAPNQENVIGEWPIENKRI